MIRTLGAFSLSEVFIRSGLSILPARRWIFFFHTSCGFVCVISSVAQCSKLIRGLEKFFARLVIVLA